MGEQVGSRDRKERNLKRGIIFRTGSGDMIWWRFERIGTFTYLTGLNAKVLGIDKAEER